MNSKTKLAVFAAGFILLIGGSLFAYNRLAADYTPETPLATVPPASSSAPVSASGSTESDELMPGEPDEAEESGQADGISAPDFTVHTAGGDAVKLSDMAGKPTIINFWASWCPPCKQEMPDFDKVYAELGEEINFMMIDAVDGARETQETGAKYIADNGFQFPVYYDLELDAVMTYGITAYPTTLFIDGEGNIVTYAQGMISEEVLRRGVAILKGEVE